MNASDIIAHHLDVHGFDGLFNASECGCVKGDLAPCGQFNPDCRPGYKAASADPEFDFVIQPNKPEAANV